MMRTYRILDGTFLLADGKTTKGVGETLDLQEDIAALHGPRLQLVNRGAASSDEADVQVEH